MTSSRTVLASFLLTFAVACGGVTLAEVAQPPHEDAGAGSPAPGVDSGIPGVDSGIPGVDSRIPGVDGGSPGLDASTGSACLTDADCESNQVCAWPADVNFCSAFNPAGTCVWKPECKKAGPLITACTCSGKTVTWESCEVVPDGWAPVGIAHLGPCPDATAPAGPSCMSDADCGAGEVCSWPISDDECNSLVPPPGTCLKLGPLCNSMPHTATGCGCGGRDVTWVWGCGAEGQPASYAPQGVAYAGPCADAAAPASCTANADCPSGEECGYEIGLACAATARCVPQADFGMCNCAGIPVCACDGTTEYIPTCCATYASKPVAYEGACAGTDGGL